MTTIYRAAAVVALVPAIGAGVEWTRDRSPAIAAWALSMMALSASLAVAAAVPAVMPNGSEPAASRQVTVENPGAWVRGRGMDVPPRGRLRDDIWDARHGAELGGPLRAWYRGAGTRLVIAARLYHDRCAPAFPLERHPVHLVR
jgi:hypothetical protein